MDWFNSNSQYCILNLYTQTPHTHNTHTSSTESAALACLYIYLPDDNLVKDKTCRKDINDRWLFITDCAICWVKYCIINQLHSTRTVLKQLLCKIFSCTIIKIINNQLLHAAKSLRSLLLLSYTRNYLPSWKLKVSLINGNGSLSCSLQLVTDPIHKTYNQSPLKIFLAFSFWLRDGLLCQPFAPHFLIKILCVTCFNHLTFLVRIIPKISGLGCKSWKPTLYSSFHPPISPASVDIVPLSTLLSHSIYIPSMASFHISISCAKHT